MKRIPRALLTAAGAVLIAVVTAATASAGGFLTGHFSTDVADGNAYWYSNANASINVNRDTFIFRPSHNGGPASISHATLLFVTIDTPTFSGSDCFQIPDSDFVESNGVQSATLNAYVDASSLCYGFPTPVDGALTGAGCGKGCPPPPVADIPLPMTVSITWTGNGVTTTATNSGHMRCSAFTAVAQQSSTSAYGSASGTLTFYDGVTAPIVLPASDFASVDQGKFQSDQQGTNDPRCFGGV